MNALKDMGDEEFVDTLYRNILAREPDSGGRQAMLGLLRKGTSRIDAVIAPAVDEAAKTVLAKKTNMRVVVADFSGVAQGLDVRSILGAMLLQERDVVVEAGKPWSDAKWP